MLDVRKPIGWLFLIIGAVLAIYALIDPQITTLQLVSGKSQTLTLNLNLPCGISMVVFACVMLALAVADDRRSASAKSDQRSPASGKDNSTEKNELAGTAR